MPLNYITFIPYMVKMGLLVEKLQWEHNIVITDGTFLFSALACL